MKHLKLSLLSLLIFAYAGAQTDFSGKWTINEGKIDWGQAPHWILPVGFNISQDNNSISVERRIVDDKMAEHPYTEKLLFDGSPTETTTYAKAKRKASIKWADDKKTFVLTSGSIGADGNPGSSVTEIWSLQDDGKTLLVERHVEQLNGGKYIIKAYFDKK